MSSTDINIMRGFLRMRNPTVPMQKIVALMMRTNWCPMIILNASGRVNRKILPDK